MKDNKSKYILAVSAALITFLVYSPSLLNEFVNWDDDDYIYANPYIKEIDITFFKWAFLSFYYANWHPLTWLSHAIDYAIWGLKPLGHHLTNNILHAINTFLVVFLVIELTEFYKRAQKQDMPLNLFITAIVTSLLFGLHPLHVESVAWVSERKDILCALFFLASIIMYLKFVKNISDNESTQPKLLFRLFNKQYLLSFGFFAIALLSKPMAVTLPVILMIIDWYPCNRVHSIRKFGQLFVEKFHFFALSFILSIVTILAQGSGNAIVQLKTLPLSLRAIAGFKTLVSYLGKMILPVNLLPFYSYPEYNAILSLRYFSQVFLASGITIFCIVFAKRQKVWLAIWSYYFVIMLPVLGIIQVGAQEMADRYTYICRVSAPFLPLALGWQDSLKKELPWEALAKVSNCHPEPVEGYL